MKICIGIGVILLFLPPVWLRAAGCLMTAVPSLILLYRHLYPMLDPGEFVFEGRRRDLLRPRGLILDPFLFLGKKAYTATLRLPLDTVPMDALRSRRDALLFLTALSLTMDDSRHREGLNQVLGSMHADKNRILKMMNIRSRLELRGSHGAVVMDGPREMAFFLLDEAPGDARRSFLSICGMIRDSGRERPMTSEDRSALMLLPDDALLLACADTSQVPSNLTFLGSLILHEIDLPDEDALSAVSSLEEKGLALTYLRPESPGYDPVAAMHIPLPPCEESTGCFTVRARGNDRRFDLAFFSCVSQAWGQALLLLWGLMMAVLFFFGILLSPGLPVVPLAYALCWTAAFLTLNHVRPTAASKPRRPFPLPQLLPLLVLLPSLLYLRYLKPAAAPAVYAAVFSFILLSWTFRLGPAMKRTVFYSFLGLSAAMLLFGIVLNASLSILLFGILAGALTGLLTALLLPRIGFAPCAPFLTRDMVQRFGSQVVRKIVSFLPECIVRLLLRVHALPKDVGEETTSEPEAGNKPGAEAEKTDIAEEKAEKETEKEAPSENTVTPDSTQE